jgi:hypothetical protein
MKLCGLVPNFYIHVSVTGLYITMIGPKHSKIHRQSDRGNTYVYINRSQIHKCKNRERGCAISCLGIFGFQFSLSVWSINKHLFFVAYFLFLNSFSTLTRAKGWRNQGDVIGGNCETIRRDCIGGRGGGGQMAEKKLVARNPIELKYVM